jgi:hypothetical protein
MDEDDLKELTTDLGHHYRRWKTHEAEKEKLRKRFFEQATTHTAEKVAARSVEVIEAVGEEEALRIAQRRYNRHRVLDVEDNDDGTWSVIYEENPTYKDFKYVNPDDGQVYQRVIAENAPYLDDQAIQDENPELWDQITRQVTRRELIPLEDLSPEDLAAIQPYISVPTPQARFPAPRKAKPEELEDEDHD